MVLPSLGASPNLCSKGSMFMMNAIKFPAPGAVDADLLGSLSQLVPSIDSRHRADTEALIKKIKNQQEDHRIHPVAYAWFRELALETLYPDGDSPIVAIGLDSLGSSCLDWRPLKPDEILIVQPDDHRSPYTTDGWSMLLNEGTSGRLKIESPTDDSFQNFLERVDEALKLFRSYAAGDYAEWRESMRMIVAVRQCTDSEIGLAGGSSLFLPGVMVVNVQYCDTTANTLATLVHEAAHVRLNSLCSHESLSLNSPDARFTSPLRADDRPMEGVIHATFVCATIVDLFSHIAAQLDDENLVEDFLEIAKNHREPVRVHAQQIAEEGELTGGGEQVLAFIRAVDDAQP